MKTQLWQNLILFLFKLIGLILNPVKKKKNDVASLTEEEVAKLLPEDDQTELLTTSVFDEPTPLRFEPDVLPSEPPRPVLSIWAQRFSMVEDMLHRPFESPLEGLPGTRQSIYEIMGRPHKKKGLNRRYHKLPKCSNRIFSDLPGSWNNGKTRIYIQEDVGEHLREALARAEELEERISELLGRNHDVVSYITKIGAYSHRNIRHKASNPLSFHSWPIAIDIDPPKNRGVVQAKRWQRRVKRNGRVRWVDCLPAQAQRGPIVEILPFSLQYWELYPESMPFELVLAFKSVHFCWGGDWGRSAWIKILEEFGDKFDMNDTQVKESPYYIDAMNEWATMRFMDPMHMELFKRGAFAEELWSEHFEAVYGNTIV